MHRDYSSACAWIPLIIIASGASARAQASDGGLPGASGAPAAPPMVVETKLPPPTLSEAAQGQEFGHAVDISGDTAVVSAWREGTGAVYVFTRSNGTWTRQARIGNPGTAAEFGSAVAIDGDRMVVGAPQEYAAYVFTRNNGTWTQQARLDAATLPYFSPSFGFGSAVDISGNWIIIGAPSEHGRGSYVGAAYLFNWNGSAWVRYRRFEPSSEFSDYEQFGAAVAVSGTTVAIGAPGHNSATKSDQGAVHVCRLGEAVQRLDPPDGVAYGYYGQAVALDGDTLAVGAPNRQPKAYVYTRSASAWSLQQQLAPAISQVDDKFGSALALVADTLVVGAPERAFGSRRPGVIYAFTRSGSAWTQQAEIPGPGQLSYVRFGTSVGLAADTLLAGAPVQTGAAGSVGFAHVYLRTNGNWIAQFQLGLAEGELSNDDEFGGGVAIDGDTLAVAAAQDWEFHPDGSGTGGSAYIYQRINGNWAKQVKLVRPNDGMTGAAFGPVMSLSGDTLAIGGAYGGGGVCIYQRNAGNWEFYGRLQPWDGSGGGFGTALQVNGDLLAVGAPADSPYSRGAVYVFRRIAGTWAPEQKVVTAPRIDYACFGVSVALEGDVLVGCGDWFTSAAGEPYGAAHVFKRIGGIWTFQQSIRGPLWHVDFGATLALSGGTFIVGAPNYGPGRVGAYRLEGSNWALEQWMDYSYPESHADFGSALDLDGNIAVIGTRRQSYYGGPNPFYVWVRQGQTWTQQASITSSDSKGSVELGFALGLSGNTVAAGAPRGGYAGGRQGAVFIYDLIFPPAIRVPPRSQAACRNELATFSVVADGTPPLAYSWQVSTDAGQTWSPAGSAQDSAYTLQAKEPISGNQYRCAISNAAGTVYSDPAALLVNVFVAGDLDQNCRVDLGDVERFAACAGGAAVPLAGSYCDPADLDGDGDADQGDFGILQRCYNGQTPPDPACDN